MTQAEVQHSVHTCIPAELLARLLSLCNEYSVAKAELGFVCQVRWREAEDAVAALFAAIPVACHTADATSNMFRVFAWLRHAL